jgi:hypothetical protein
MNWLIATGRPVPQARLPKMRSRTAGWEHAPNSEPALTILTLPIGPAFRGRLYLNQPIQSRRKIDMRGLALFALLLLLPDAAVARCAPFNFFESLNKIPYVVRGRVIQSNSDSLLSRQCGPAICQHKFSIEVLEVMKGKTAATELHFQYDYVGQRPQIALFEDDTEYVFAITRIGDSGRATLLGTTCGRSGLGIKYLDEIKRALKR